MSHTYHQINVGRGAGEDKLERGNWELLKLDIVTAINRFTVKPVNVELHAGVGYWEGEPEESAHLSFLAESGDVDYRNLRIRLAEIADHYGQDAIALIVADSELIGPSGADDLTAMEFHAG